MDSAEKLSFLSHFKGIIAGTDEAGRGPLAGPVVAAAVILSKSQEDILLKLGLKDSKKLNASCREGLFLKMSEIGVLWGAQAASVYRIARQNVSQASLWAMKRAVCKLSVVPDLVVVDGLYQISDLSIDQLPLVRADDQVPVVAAASVVAKVLRDRVMITLDSVYPAYGFAKHKGYATQAHRNLVGTLGLSPIHRRSFCTKFLQEVR